MSDKYNKKRKRAGEGEAAAKKKVAVVGPPSTASVSSIMRPRLCPPVIASSTGLDIPAKTAFQSYIPRNEVTKKQNPPTLGGNKDFLLHSTEHHSLDYTARNELARGIKAPLNHFLAVYDPQTGKMEVVEARKMLLRGTVRAKKASAEAMGEKNVLKSHRDRKTDLGQTFGTKKAKKAIDENVINALLPQKKADGTPQELDQAGQAMLVSVGDVAKTMSTREQLDAAINDAKPVPRPNLEAEDVQDVYHPTRIIGEDMLNLVPIREWQEKVRHSEGVQTPSLFVANRVNALASNNSTELQLRVLRYYSFVLLFYLKSKPGKGPGGRMVPRREELRETLAPAPEAVVENIRRKFSDAGQIRKFHVDLLMTHMCAFACTIDHFQVDTQDLRQDLRLDQGALNGYFKEIGATIGQVSNKAEGRTTQVARLALPLTLPKQRRFTVKRK